MIKIIPSLLPPKNFRYLYIRYPRKFKSSKNLLFLRKRKWFAIMWKWFANEWKWFSHVWEPLSSFENDLQTSENDFHMSENHYCPCENDFHTCENHFHLNRNTKKTTFCNDGLCIFILIISLIDIGFNRNQNHYIKK